MHLTYGMHFIKRVCSIFKKIVVCFSALATIFVIYCSAGRALPEIEQLSEEHISISQISNFAIDSSGNIAIAFSDDFINVYNESGNFMYGYKILDDLGQIGVYYNENDDLILRGSRSKSYYIKDHSIQIRESSDKYVSMFNNFNMIKKNDALYIVKGFIAQKIIKIQDNVKTVIYQDTNSVIIFRIIILLTILSILVLGITKTILNIHENKYRKSDE